MNTTLIAWFMALSIMLAVCATVFLCFIGWVLAWELHDYLMQRHLRIKNSKYTSFAVGRDLKDLNGVTRHV